MTAGCGTTVTGRALDRAEQQGGLQPGQTVSSSSGADGSSGTPAAGSAGQPQATGGGVGGQGSATDPTSGTSTTTGVSGVPGSAYDGQRGVTAVAPAKNSAVVVGVITSGNAGAFAGSLGINANYGDQRKQSQAVADYLNAHGGIQGHPVKLTFYDYNTTGGGPGNAQAACAAFTQDQHAFAAIGIAAMDDAYHACAAKAGMFVLSDGDLKSTDFFHHYPTTIEVSDADVVRKYAAEVYAFHNEGFFTPGAKIGILYTDEPNDQQGVRDGMKPALAKLGLKVTSEAAINATDASANASDISSAVLKFQANGVTHVLFGVGAAYVFDQAAAQQQYYPYMAVDSRQSPGLLLQTAAPAKELVKTWGFGYQPIQDVDGSHDPGPVSDREQLCNTILKAAGQSSSATRLATASALYLCDELFFTRDALTGQPDISRTSFLGGVASLGTRYHSTLTFSTQFSARQHDGAESYRPLRFISSCTCFQYSGPLRPFPTG